MSRKLTTRVRSQATGPPCVGQRDCAVWTSAGTSRADVKAATIFTLDSSPPHAATFVDRRGVVHTHVSRTHPLNLVGIASQARAPSAVELRQRVDDVGNLLFAKLGIDR